MINWVRSFAQQLYQIFQSLVNWIYSNIPLVANTINSAIIWLYNSLVRILNSIIDAFDTGSQARSSTQSAQDGLSAMMTSVQQSSDDGWNQLSARLSQVAGNIQAKFNDFCGKYQPALGTIKGLTRWIAPVVGGVLSGPSAGVLNPANTVAGALLLENTIDAGCSLSKTGTVDSVQVISITSSATDVLGLMFPNEEGQFHAIGNILAYVGVGIPLTKQLLDSMSSSGFDFSSIFSIMSSYQSASSQGNSAYQSSTHDYLGAINALAPIVTLPILDAVNSVLGDVRPCAKVLSQFSSYTQEGMVAPDLQNKVQSCQQMGQTVISSISRGDYNAIIQASTLVTLASELSSSIETRHQQFIAAKTSLDMLTAAVTSIDSCGFLWVQPDPRVVSQGRQALQLAQSQFSSGKYTEVMNTSSQDSISELNTASHVCGRDATNAKIELVGMVIAAIAVSGFAYFRKTGPSGKRSEKAANG